MEFLGGVFGFGLVLSPSCFCVCLELGLDS